MYWADITSCVSLLEVEDKYGKITRLARLTLVFGEWVAQKHDGVQQLRYIGKYSTLEEAKAVTVATIRMEQADGTIFTMV